MRQGKMSGRTPVRYEASKAAGEEGRSEGSGSSSQWVGAFERVMGDQPQESFSASKSRPRITPRSSTSMLGSGMPTPQPTTVASIPVAPSSSFSPSNASPSSHPPEMNKRQNRSRSSRPGGGGEDAAKRRSELPASQVSGPPLIVVSETSSLLLDDVYLNHAPGLLPVKIRNVDESSRVLVRLGSDLGRGLAFMKRKRTVVSEGEK